MRQATDVGSTHTKRCIEGLRRRAVKYGDDYLNVVADEMERTYQALYTARRALMVAEKVVAIGLRVPEDEE